MVELHLVTVEDVGSNPIIPDYHYQLPTNIYQIGSYGVDMKRCHVDKRAIHRHEKGEYYDTTRIFR